VTEKLMTINGVKTSVATTDATKTKTMVATIVHNHARFHMIQIIILYRRKLKCPLYPHQYYTTEAQNHLTSEAIAIYYESISILSNEIHDLEFPAQVLTGRSPIATKV